MNRHLTIVVRNISPKRERQYPRSWLLFASDRDPVRIHISHSFEGAPKVTDKSAA
jgi:hypothetical protein